MEIKEQKPVSWAVAKEILEEKEGKKELVYEQKNALDHLRKFSKVSHKKVGEAFGKLSEIKGLGEKNIITIIDHMPEDLDDLRVLLSGKADISADEKKKILDIIKNI